MSQSTVHFVVMGVSGCGKTTAAIALKQHYRCPYAEGDDFHSQANRDKMGSGIPLTDEDRYPWLRSLRDWMSSQAQSGEAVSVVTCSALKREYRDILRPLQNPQKSSKFPLTSNSENLEDFVHEQLFTHRCPQPHRKTSRPLPTHQTRPYS